MFIKVEDNPNGGEDNKKAKWWKDWIGKKKEVHDTNTKRIEELEKQCLNLTIQQSQTHMELAILCKKYDTLVKQLAAEERIKNNTEHRRLEVDED